MTRRCGRLDEENTHVDRPAAAEHPVKDAAAPQPEPFAGRSVSARALFFAGPEMRPAMRTP